MNIDDSIAKWQAQIIEKPEDKFDLLLNDNANNAIQDLQKLKTNYQKQLAALQEQGNLN